MKKIINTVVIILIFFAVLSCSAKGGAGQNRDTSLVEEISRRGVLKVGISTFVPWAIQDKTGEFIGFEIDVARRLADDMGVKIEFIPTKWSGIIPALLTEKFDIIICGMGIRAERNYKINFSIPYDYTGMSIVASKELVPGLTTIEQFNRKDFIIAARIGTTAADSVKKRIPLAQLKLFDDESQAIQELLNKKAHAVVASAPLPAYQAIEYPDQFYLPIKENFTKEPIGFALRKGDVDTLNFFDSWIRVADAEGFLAERKNYWFNTRDWALLVE